MLSNPVLVTAPAQLPLSLEAVKTFLRVDGSSEDDLITLQIKAATRRLEALCDAKFVTQTWDVFFDSTPLKAKDDWWDGVREGAISEMYVPARFLNLPFGPMQSVTGVYTYDDANTEYEFTNTNYFADTSGPFGRIGLKTGSVWPATVLRPSSGLKVRAVFGFGAGYIPADDPDPAVESTIPEDIQEAIKQFTGILYEHRGDELPKIPASVSMLLEPYRRFKVGC